MLCVSSNHALFFDSAFDLLGVGNEGVQLSQILEAFPERYSALGDVDPRLHARLVQHCVILHS